MIRRALLTAVPAVALGWRRAVAAEAPRKRVPLSLIVSASSPVVNLSLAKLRALFLGQLVFDEAGTKLLPFNQPPGSPVRVAFDRVVLGMEPDEVGRYWIDRRIRGQGSPPRAVDPTSLLQRVVAKIPGAVGYLAPELLIPQVRALTIDGRAASNARYPVIITL
jgi:hypothetical protein